MIDMNKQESTLGLSVRDRAKQSLRSHRALIECAVYTVTGFVSANAFVLADLAPFGIAFAAAAKPQFYPAAVIGSILGYVLSFSSLGNVKYVLASMLLFAVRWAFSSGTLMKNTTVAPPVLTAVSLGIPSLAIAIATGGDVYAVVLVVSEVLLACCASYFFARTIQSIDLGWENLQQTDITSMINTF